MHCIMSTMLNTVSREGYGQFCQQPNRLHALTRLSGFIEPNIQTDITQFVERLLNTMELQNGSFVFRSSEVAVAAIDVSGTRTERT